MKTSRNAFLLEPFVFTSNDARKIFTALTDIIGPPIIEIDCSDNLTRQFTELKDLLNFENSPSQLIQGVSFISISNDQTQRASIHILSSKGSTIILSLEGEEHASVT